MDRRVCHLPGRLAYGDQMDIAGDVHFFQSIGYRPVGQRFADGVLYDLLRLVAEFLVHAYTPLHAFTRIPINI